LDVPTDYTTSTAKVRPSAACARKGVRPVSRFPPTCVVACVPTCDVERVLACVVAACTCVVAACADMRHAACADVLGGVWLC
jgi:hypothetical protein